MKGLIFVGVVWLVLFGVMSMSVWHEEKQEGAPMIVPTAFPTAIPTRVPTPTPGIQSVLHEVPFTSQAPFGEWDDPRQQDGCEEAVTLMLKCSMFKVQCPIKDGKIDQVFAKVEILKMAGWQTDNYGSYVDTSAEDTADRLIGEYLGYHNYEVIKILSHQEIVRELMRGSLVVVPTDGRKLANPFFTAGGPERHMLVVIGYDVERAEFITNDPGTRSGRGYRYPEEILWQAIGNYPTGEHKPIGGRSKIMIGIRY